MYTCLEQQILQARFAMQVKEWLGHSTIATTADLYGHLDYSAKVATAEAMAECLDLDIK